MFVCFTFVSSSTNLIDRSNLSKYSQQNINRYFHCNIFANSGKVSFIRLGPEQMFLPYSVACTINSF